MLFQVKTRDFGTENDEEIKGGNTSPRASTTGNGSSINNASSPKLERSGSTTSLRHGSSVQSLLNPTPSNTSSESEEKKTTATSSAGGASRSAGTPVAAVSSSSSSSSASVSSAVSPVSEKTKGPESPSVSRGLLSPGGSGGNGTLVSSSTSLSVSSSSALRVSKKLILMDQRRMERLH